MRRTTVRPDHEALVWSGAVEVQHTPQWSQAWRLPHSRIDLFHDDILRSRAGMAAGVRIRFATDSPLILARAVPSDDWADVGPMDLVVDGEFHASVPPEADGTFTFDGLRSERKEVSLWLPQFGTVRLAGIELAADARLGPPRPEHARRLITYGSSITHCRTAESPTSTWPAAVSRLLGLDLTCLGFGGQCHLDPHVARMIRDRPADVIVTCIGINVYGAGTFNERSFLPAVLGFVAAVRDGHPGAPILVISPIHSPSREDTPGLAGMTLTQIRDEVSRAVRLLREHGDPDLHLLDGLDVIGPDDAGYLADGIHPNAAGYRLMAQRIAPEVDRLLGIRSPTLA
jgi:hypothetical protein